MPLRNEPHHLLAAVETGPQRQTQRKRLSSQAAAAGRRRRGTMLELVNETIDQEIDVTAVHDALARLLLRFHARQSAQGSDVA